MPSEWVTVAEAKELLGYGSDGGAMRACRRKGIPERREPMDNGGVGRCLFSREGVDLFAAELRFVDSMKASGMKRCPTCKEWKTEPEFYTSNVYCIGCERLRARSRKKPKREAPEERWPIGIIMAGPPTLRDSIKYACMAEGYSHRPIPRGMTKREAFCAHCTAPRCVHRPEFTPAEVLKLRSKGARVPLVVGIPRVIPTARGRTFMSRR